MASLSLMSTQVRYPRGYLWVVLLAALDAMFTFIILQLGGWEVNPVANWLLGQGGFAAMVGFKFIVIAMVIVICEYVDRHRQDLARTLVGAAVVLNALPVAAALGQLGYRFGPMLAA